MRARDAGGLAPFAGAARRAACALAVALAACGAPAPASAGGGSMDATVKTIGEVGPRRDESGAVTTSRVDVAPIVLWDRAGQPLVLRYESETNRLTGHVKQRFARADERKAGPFPVAASDTLPDDAETEDLLDLYDTDHVPVADLDGDGADELVLLRQGGGAEVLGIDRVVARPQGIGSRATIAGYFPRVVHRARAGSKDVLFVVHARKVLAKATDAELASRGYAERNRLVRIDERGAAPLTLEADGFRPEKVIALGAVSRPGSAGIDELVVVSRTGADDPVLSRHAPDGKLLAPPRKIYVPFPDSADCAFEFLPQSGRAVAFDRGAARVYFVAPEKPANWIRAVELGKLPELASSAGRLLGVADASTAPKAIVQAGAAVYAVDEAGAFFVAGPDGAWAAAKKPDPFFRIAAPSPAHHLLAVARSATRADEFLVVHDRAPEARTLSLEELEAAAERYVAPKKLALHRSALVPRLDDEDAMRDRIIDEERARKGLERPKTVDEWRTRLPESYAKWNASARATYQIALKVALFPEGEPRRVGFRDYEGWVAWRDGLVAPGETAFALVRRGAVAAAFRAAGYHPFRDPVLRRPIVDFRARGNAVTAVLALDVGAPGKPAPRFAVVTGP
ncbi:MAG TPA: hypothetical protein VFL83_23040 [Anaeromyxobacter sp.]|nr:hypothetical protein [Anaeromyxobacter sp.]